MLSEHNGRKLNFFYRDYVIFDLETTGTSCLYDSIIEISALRIRGGFVSSEFSTLVNPCCHIPFSASMVNGITDRMVSECPCIETVFPAFLDFIGDDILVGHNIAAFDMRFLNRIAMNYYGKNVGNDYVDTLTLSRQLMPDMNHHALSDMAAVYGVSYKGAHRALADCRINHKVYECLRTERERAEERGVCFCPDCGAILRLKVNKRSEYMHCSAYPKCRYREPLCMTKN